MPFLLGFVRLKPPDKWDTFYHGGLRGFFTEVEKRLSLCAYLHSSVVKKLQLKMGFTREDSEVFSQR